MEGYEGRVGLPAAAGFTARKASRRRRGVLGYSLDDKLVVGISSRALFDLSQANAVYETEGLAAYRAYQRDREDEILSPGTGFPLVRGLLAINRLAPERLVEVVVISRNDAESAMRVFRSIDHYGLDISRGAFTNGGDSWRYIRPFHCSLFLSQDPGNVLSALERDLPAALLLAPPEGVALEEEPSPVRVAFDGDAVLFGDESERVFQADGLDAFHEHERLRHDEPMRSGPFRPFLEALGRIQARFPSDASPIRTALVTSRGAPAHHRVINTLRSWQVRLDETFFLGGVEKAEILRELRPHIFFDDQLRHLEPAAESVPMAHVITTGQQLELLPTASLPPPRQPRTRNARPARPARQKAAAPGPVAEVGRVEGVSPPRAPLRRRPGQPVGDEAQPTETEAGSPAGSRAPAARPSRS